VTSDGRTLNLHAPAAAESPDPALPDPPAAGGAWPRQAADAEHAGPATDEAEQRRAALGPPLTFDSADLCHHLRCHPSTLARMRAAGRLPRAFRFGSQLRWLRDEVERWTMAGMPSFVEWEAMEAARTNGRPRG
jgi:hypothetical protein